MGVAHIKTWLPRALLLFSLCTLSFAYGVIVGYFRLFPFNVIHDAHVAGRALVQTTRTVDDPGLSSYQQSVVVPTVRQFSPQAGTEMILVSGGAGYLTQYHAPGCLAWLVDREGHIHHTWKYDPQLWRTLQHVTRVPGVSGDPYPVGMHLFADGGLLVTYHAGNTFPFAVGLARFDVDSNLIWRKELLTHHWFTVAPDGRIFVPALHVADSPIPIGRTDVKIHSGDGKIYRDVVLILDSDGNVLDEISMLDACFSSGWSGLFTRPVTSMYPEDPLTNDPLHLNDVQLVTDQYAQSHPWLSPGDLLVSFRNVNTVAILDPQTRRFKWVSSGTTVCQHSPRFCAQGVLVLDNLGGDASMGGTQLVRIDFANGLPSTVFPRPGVNPPELCRTLSSGHLDLHPDGHRVLMSVTHQGTLWEIDLQTGEVLWEYVYVHPQGEGRRMSIHTAKYVSHPAFLEGRDQL